MPINTIEQVHKSSNGNKILYSSVYDFKHSSRASAVIVNYVLVGAEHYYVESKMLHVKSSHYVIINNEQSFDVLVEYNRSCVAALAVYLSEALLEDVCRNFQGNEIGLLDNPFCSGNKKFEFFESTYTNDPLQHHLESMRETLNSTTKPPVIPDDAIYFTLAKYLLLAQGRILKEAFQIQAKSPLVKRELYRRVQTAKTILDESSENLHISNLATEVALSEFHFYRTFKQAFGVSPHAYQIQRKCKKAALLLRQHDISVGEIAYSSGFSDIFSFSKAFKAFYNLSPLQYRKQFSRI